MSEEGFKSLFSDTNKTRKRFSEKKTIVAFTNSPVFILDLNI